MRTVAIPMAGRGTRLKDLAPIKILAPIDVEGTPLFVHAVRHLGFSFDRLVLIARKEHGVPEIARRWFGERHELHVVELEEETSGPLETVLRARAHLGGGELVIANSDQVMNWPGDWALNWFRERGAVGGIPTVERTSLRHSYCAIDPAIPHRVLRVAEKEAISRRASIGIYWFRDGAEFLRAADASFAKKLPPLLKEYYVAPVYNELDGLVLEYPLCEFWSIGETENFSAYQRRDFALSAKD